MEIHRLDHVGIIVNDLAAAKAPFLDFGLGTIGEYSVKVLLYNKSTHLLPAANDQQSPESPAMFYPGLLFAAIGIALVSAMYRQPELLHVDYLSHQLAYEPN